MKNVDTMHSRFMIQGSFIVSHKLLDIFILITPNVQSAFVRQYDNNILHAVSSPKFKFLYFQWFVNVCLFLITKISLRLIPSRYQSLRDIHPKLLSRSNNIS